MTMFQINIKGENKGHIFNSVSQAYTWVCQNVMTEGDIEYYKSIGNKTPLYQIQNENIQEVVLRNAFEKICFSGWNDRVDLTSPYLIIHKEN